MSGVLDQCRVCGHPRRAHALVGLSTRLCHSSGACDCRGFAPSHLTWLPGPDSVESVSGREWFGLPSPEAAVQLAEALSDVDDMLTRVTT